MIVAARGPAAGNDSTRDEPSIADRVSFAIARAWYRLDQKRGCVQVAGGAALARDVAPDALDLLRAEMRRLGHLARRGAMVEAVEAEVHLAIGQREIELLLRLRQRPGIGGRR